MRSYGEYCALAKSLDVIGNRWTLLIVRELLIRGPSRYTDLREGLPGIATNLLAERLRELEEAGLVAREEAPPPVATTLFRLTPRGEELRPVVERLMLWGAPLMTVQDPKDVVRSHWLAFALESMLSDHDPGEPAVTIELRTGDQPIRLETEDGAVRARAASAQQPDAILAGPPRPILGFLTGWIELDAAEAAGVRHAGDPKAFDRVRGSGVNGNGATDGRHVVRGLGDEVA
jgi:DNA-binding HxlR family transcriptional regulator